MNGGLPNWNISPKSHVNDLVLFGQIRFDLIDLP